MGARNREQVFEQELGFSGGIGLNTKMTATN